MFNANERNNEVRSAIEEFRKANFNPSQKNLADAIGMNYTMFADFYRGQRNLGQEALKKIEKFLNKHQ